MTDIILKEKLLSQESCQSVSRLLNGMVLEDFQCVDLLKLLYWQRAIAMYDTGLGKTLLSASAMKALVNEVPNRKFIFIGENAQLIQTPGDIERYTGLRVGVVTGERDVIDRVFHGRNFDKIQVLFMTYESLNSFVAMRNLYMVRDKFYGVVVDEAHMISNYVNAESAFMLRSILRNYKFRLALTATPVTTNMGQMARLMHMFNWDRFDDPIGLQRALENKRFNVDFENNFLFIRNRSDLGIVVNYNSVPVFVEPHPHQIGAFGMDVLLTCKGEGSVNQAKEVVKLVKNKSGFRGLIYVNQHKVREWLLPFLESEGVRVACMNGKTSKPDKKRIQDEFAEGKYDVVITSLTRSINMDCDYIIFYEFCVDIKQMMGRAVRGLNPKTLDLYFIFTLKTGEIEYFTKNIYERSLSIQEVLKKDYSELIKVGRLLSSS